MPEKTLLALDIGNTNVVLGIFRDDQLVIRRRLATHSGRTSDEAGVLVKMLCLDSGVRTEEIDAVAIASVSPKAGMVYGLMSESYLNCKPYFITGEIQGFVNRYKNPMAVGADRVCDAVAGYTQYGGPLMVLDFGTAITIDVIDEDGAYLGGVIMPGLEVSSETLHKAAALLPAVRLSMPKTAIGKTTEESIRIGLMKGAVASIRGLMKEICEEQSWTNVKAIATGGLAQAFTPHIPEIQAVEPDLVLKGIYLIYQRIAGEKK